MSRWTNNTTSASRKAPNFSFSILTFTDVTFFLTHMCFFVLLVTSSASFRNFMTVMCNKMVPVNLSASRSFSRFTRFPLNGWKISNKIFHCLILLTKVSTQKQRRPTRTWTLSRDGLFSSMQLIFLIQLVIKQFHSSQIDGSDAVARKCE